MYKVESRGFESHRNPPFLPLSFHYSYQVQVHQPVVQRGPSCRVVRKFHGKFGSVIELKVKLLKVFENLIPQVSLSL